MSIKIGSNFNELILRAIQKHKINSVSAIQRYLQGSKGTIHRQFNKLQEAGYIKIDSDGYFLLTRQGEIALEIADREREIVDFEGKSAGKRQYFGGQFEKNKKK